MSTDYSKMSDFEINCRVHSEVMEISGLDSFKAKDYCNNPADAWPIIVNNSISLECIVVNRHEKTWRAQFKTAYVKHRVNHKNPLRAAMIVFLMMQESKNAS
jgi:hypothetical protein